MRSGIKSVLTAVGVIAVQLTPIKAEGQPEAPPYEPSDAFRQIEKLEGKWTGTLSRSHLEDVDLTIDYKVISNRSAIVETMHEGDMEMISIYHDRNDELMVTHYCSLRNQPVLNFSQRTDTTVSFAHDPSSGLKEGEDTFVNSYKIIHDPKNPTELRTAYTVTIPDGSMWTHEGVLKKASQD